MGAQEVFFAEPVARSHRETPLRGRNPVQPTPEIAPSDQWLDAWDGYELRELSRERSMLTIRSRKSVVIIMARHLTEQDITDPCAATKSQLNRYLLAQYRDRKPGGKVALYQAVRHFFDWLADEYETANPAAGIPARRARPRPSRWSSPSRSATSWPPAGRRTRL